MSTICLPVHQQRPGTHDDEHQSAAYPQDGICNLGSRYERGDPDSRQAPPEQDANAVAENGAKRGTSPIASGHSDDGRRGRAGSKSHDQRDQEELRDRTHRLTIAFGRQAVLGISSGPFFDGCECSPTARTCDARGGTLADILGPPPAAGNTWARRVTWEP